MLKSLVNAYDGTILFSVPPTPFQPPSPSPFLTYSTMPNCNFTKLQLNWYLVLAGWIIIGVLIHLL